MLSRPLIGLSTWDLKVAKAVAKSYLQEPQTTYKNAKPRIREVL